MTGTLFFTGLFLLGLSWIQTTQAILSSDPATPLEFTYQICLRHTSPDGPCLCSGALVNSYSVITSAECLRQLPPTTPITFALAGAHDSSKFEPLQQERTIRNITVHPLNNKNTIALLDLSEPFQLNGYIQPIGFKPAGTVRPIVGPATLSGWGSTTVGGQIEDTLHKKDVTILAPTVCETHWNAADAINSTTNLCAWDPAATPPTSVIGTGDHGNPLLCSLPDGTRFLCGLLAYGFDTTGTPPLDPRPDIYIRVSAYADWINQNIRQDRLCKDLGHGYWTSAFPGQYFHCVWSPAQSVWLKYVFPCPNVQTQQEFNETTQKCETKPVVG